jgi:hypothetical protein
MMIQPDRGLDNFVVVGTIQTDRINLMNPITPWLRTVGDSIFRCLEKKYVFNVFGCFHILSLYKFKTALYP